MNSKFKYKILLALIAVVVTKESYAQLGGCSGNSGDPIFIEDFGTAPSSATQHVSLPIPGSTTYAFLGNPPTVFADSLYTVSNMNYQQWNWFNEEDHTEGDSNGRMLVVNASFTPGEFYRLPVSGLCENTTYTFSSWVKNLTPRNLLVGGSTPNPCNVRFEIWNSADTTILRSESTGDFFGALSSENGEWLEFAFSFQTGVGENSVILKMVNNGIGGYGNDIAIDDIVFQSCGDRITVEDTSNNNSVNVCSSQTPYTTVLTAIPDNTVFSSHFYQWQESTDGTVWTDLSAQTNPTLSVTGISTTTYYRSKVAESAINVNNASCNTVSDVFEINITQAPVQPFTECWETATFSDTTCSWSITGTQPPQPSLECWQTTTFNTSTCVWDTTGTQDPMPTGLECWETATFNNTTCIWSVTGTQPPQPSLECWQTTTFNTSTCVWDITGTQDPMPTGLECWEAATFNNTTCIWSVTGTQDPMPTGLECWETATFSEVTCLWSITGNRPGQVFNEEITFCSGDTPPPLRANTNIPDPIYLWNTGAVSDVITIPISGRYSVEISSSTSCIFETRNFNVIEIEAPVIESVISDGNNIIITTTNSGDFLYSLDGNIFQSSNVFKGIPGGQYRIAVRGRNCDDTVFTTHLHFYIPKFFTPNNDGYHDTFHLGGIEYFNSSQVSIFDRYGKLLKSTVNSSFSWDGTFNNQRLPTADYWYVIIVDNQKFTGHFTLKR